MNHHDELTTRLTRQLHDQADGLHGAPLTFETVRGRAHTIRRNRRLATTTAAALAVAAIAIPTTLLGDGTGRTDTPPPVVETPERTVQGSGLGVPFATGRTLTLPDGSLRQLPRQYDEVAVVGEEVLGVRGEPGSADYVLDRIARDGTVEQTLPLGGSSIARNADGSAIAYVSPEADLVVESADGSFELGTIGGTRGLADVRPLRLVGGPDCEETDDCAVYFKDGENAWLVGADNGVALGDGLVTVDDVSETGLVSGISRLSEDDVTSCSVVRRRTDGATVRETCDHTLDRFSPDGSLVTALPPYLSGAGPSRVTILDVGSGRELATYEAEDGYVHDTGSTWEDEDHLLVVARDLDNRTWSVVRLGADGSEELVLGPTPGSQSRPPWTLAGGR